MKTDFFLCFLKDSSFLKYKPPLVLASGYDRSKKKKSTLKKNKEKERALKKEL